MHHDGSIRWIARIFRVSTSFIVRLLQRRRPPARWPPSRTGADRPRPVRADLERLAALIREPDATLEQLKQQGGFHVA